MINSSNGYACIYKLPVIISGGNVLNSEDRWKAAVRNTILSQSHINLFLQTRFGEKLVKEYYDFSFRLYFQRFHRKHGEKSFSEFIDYLSYLGDFLGQAHMVMNMDEEKQTASFVVVDCMPLDIMEEDRNFYLSGNFPCDIWCNNFFLKFSKFAGYKCELKEHEEGCLFEISPETQSNDE